MKTNRIILIITVLCFSLLGTGCGEPLYEMTSEEESIIALYSAKAVAKFNKNQITGIANARVRKGELDEEYKPEDQGQEEDSEIEGEENTEEEIVIDPETGEEIVVPAEEEAEGSGDTDNSGADGYSFTNAVAIEGVNFTCSEFDVTTEYKPSSSYIMSRMNGKQYLVLYITAENTSDSAVDFSQYANRKYSLSLNGGEETKALFTPLQNDLANFRGSLSAGDTKSFILVFSFSDSAVQNITSLELFVTSDGTTRGTSI